MLCTSKTGLLSILLLYIFYPAASQDTFSGNPFTPHGSPFGRIFTNFHVEIDGNERSSAFAVDRAYLGYQYFLSPEFSAFVKIDVGSPNDLSEYSKIRRYAYFKNAGFTYHKNRLTWSFGLIDTKQLSLQEKVWNHRYIMKSYQDQYAFGPKADLGTEVAWQFTPWLTVDFSLLNGEGYKQLQLDNTYKSAAGITLTPLKKVTFRMYGDIMVKNVTASNLAFFLAWQGKRIHLGSEFNYRINDNFTDDHNMWGTSFYGMYEITAKFEVFGRYDYLTSNPTDLPDVGWNFNHDGSAVIAGIQYMPLQNFKVSINYQDWYPWPKNFDNSAYIFVNFEINL